MGRSASVKSSFPCIFGGDSALPGIPLGHAAADTCLAGGLRPGVLHEVFPAAPREAPAASGFALALARRALAPKKWLLWVRQDFSAIEAGDIHAAGLLEFGIDPARVLMVRAPDAMGALRAGAEGLDCKGMGAVIAETWGKSKLFGLAASRRLMLAAGRHGVTLILLHFGAQAAPSAAETRWLIRAAPSPAGAEDWGSPEFDAALVRNRHGACGRWIMKWDCSNGIFQAHSRALAATPFHRPSAAPLESSRQADRPSARRCRENR